MGSQTFQIKVSGNGCPIELQLAASSQILTTSFRGSLVLHYLATDPQFAEINEVYGIDLKGQGAFAADRNGEEWKLKGDGQIEGALLTRANGKLPLSLIISGSGNVRQTNVNGAYVIAFQMQFPDFLVDMKEVTEYDGSQEPHSLYLLNGESLSKEEFYGYFLKVGGQALAGQPPLPSQPRFGFFGQ
jgi:hypothetical protein